MAAPNSYGGAPPMMEHPEVGSLKSILNTAKIVALVWMIILGLWGLGELAVALAFSVFFVGVLTGPIYLFIAAVVMFLTWQEIPKVEAMVNAQQYRAARDALLLWMILGFIFGFLLGIILLIAYVKFDPILATGGVVPMAAAPGYLNPAMPYSPAPGAAVAPPPAATGAPPPATAPPIAPAPPPTATVPVAPGVTPCPRCGRPLTWIPQYSRWYCYSDGQYA